VVEAELHFTDEQVEVALEAAVVDLQPPLGVAPEVLDAVDMAATVGEGLGVIDALVMEAVERQVIIGFIAVGVDDGVQLDVVHDCADELLAVTASGQDDPDLAAALQEAEDRYLAGGAPAALALARTAEVGLVGLDVSVELGQLGLAVGGDSLPKALVMSVGGVSMKTQVLGRPDSRNTEPEQPGDLIESISAEPVARSSETVGEQLPASLALAAPVGAAIMVAVLAARTFDVPIQLSAIRHMASLFGGRIAYLHKSELVWIVRY
jgi:hypothetical protein